MPINNYVNKSDGTMLPMSPLLDSIQNDIDTCRKVMVHGLHSVSITKEDHHKLWEYYNKLVTVKFNLMELDNESVGVPMILRKYLPNHEDEENAIQSEKKTPVKLTYPMWADIYSILVKSKGMIPDDNLIDISEMLGKLFIANPYNLYGPAMKIFNFIKDLSDGEFDMDEYTKVMNLAEDMARKRAKAEGFLDDFRTRFPWL